MDLIKRLFFPSKTLYTIFSFLFMGCFGARSETAFSPVVEDYFELDSTLLSISVMADSLGVPWDLQYSRTDSSLYFTEWNCIFTT